MKTVQFFKIVRSYAELARRTRKNYGDLVDAAAIAHADWLAKQPVPPADPETHVFAIVEREYDPAFRSYPKP